MINPNENRPGATSEAIPNSSIHSTADSLQGTAGLPIPHLSRSEVADAIPAYVLIVKTPTQRVTRRVYLSLHSAVKACERARTRGHAATLELARYAGDGDAL